MVLIECCQRLFSHGGSRILTRHLKSSSTTISGGQILRQSSSFKASDLEVTIDESKRRPPSGFKPVGFCNTMAPHMFEVEYSEQDGWGRPRIVPVHDLQIHPAAKCLHYSLELFEGTKAYRGIDDKVRLFRPEHNMRRMNASAKRICLPEFDVPEMVQCIKRLLQIDAEWVPPPEDFQSTYIRPTLIGTQGQLGVTSSDTALLYVITFPSGCYFPSGIKPISLLADPQYVRAWRGGCGDKKLGANYGPSIYVQRLAQAKGHGTVLWLYGDDHQLTELGFMNVFVYMINESGEKELVTPPLEDGLILPGVVRTSIVELAKQWGEFKVSERRMNMKEILKLLDEGRLLEIFGSGTACVVLPVERIEYLGRDLRIPTMEQKPEPLWTRFLSAVTDIQYGKLGDHPWTVDINAP